MPLRWRPCHSRAISSGGVRWKLFFRSAQANYDLARTGTLRIMPNDALLANLKRDYDRMQEMFFDEPPAFAEITRTLAELEARINSLA